MFVTISTYQARAGEEDAIIALHEDWQHTLQPMAAGYLSGELLRNIENVQQFVSVRHFESREAAEVLEHHPEQRAWYQRLVSLTEFMPTITRCTYEF